MDWGGSGRPCLLVHPTGFVGQLWKPYIGRLASRFHCFTTDRRGHGLSGKPETGYDWLSMSDDLAAVLEAYGVSGALGIGHSAGATDIAITAARRPGSFSQLVLLDPIIFDEAPPLGEDGIPDNPMARGTLKRRAIWTSRDEVRSSYSSRAPFASWAPGFLEPYVQHGFLDCEDGSVELACPPAIEARLYGQTQEFGIWELLATVAAESLLLAGDRSDAFPSDKFRRASETLPNCTAVMLPEAGHFFPFEQPERVWELMDAFLG
jgi:pimeloyl-ACP methyl ester carboxylesterase